MNKHSSNARSLTRLMAFILAGVIAGCGGGGGGGGGVATVVPGAGANPTVGAASPGSGDVGVPVSSTGPGGTTGKTLSATFSTAMDPATVTAPGTFTLKVAGGADVPGTVTMDVTNTIATFTPTGGPLLPNTTYTAKISTAAMTAAVPGPSIAIAAPVVWSFTTAGAGSVSQATPPNLGEAGRFVILASQAVTNVPTSAISGGDLGIMDQARSAYAGFTPSGSAGDFTELTGGTSHASDDANPAPFPAPLKFATVVIGSAWATTLAMIDQSRTDLGTANTFLGGTNPTAPDQVLPIQLGNLTLTPGVYRAGADVQITTGALQLDALGDANAVWIFDIAGTLTTGAPGGNITFVSGVGQAKNVFWRTSGITTIGASTSFIGNVFAMTQVNLLAGAAVTGRLFGITDRVTLITNAVTMPP
jgi:hypothetical protein